VNKVLAFSVLLFFSFRLNGQEIEEYFHPKENFEQRKDTLLADIPVSWVFRTIPGKYITQQYQDDEVLQKYHFRDTELAINTRDFKLSFNKMHFQDTIGFDPQVFNMRFLGLKEFNPKTEELQFFLTIQKPDTDWTFPIYLFVKLNGTSRFELPVFEDDY